MDDLTPTEYPQPITGPSKTLEALPYRKNPYGNNPYEIAPPPPKPEVKTVKVKDYGPIKQTVTIVVVIGITLIIGSSIMGYSAGSASTQTNQASQAIPTDTSALTGTPVDYQNGYTDGYNAGKSDGQTSALKDELAWFQQNCKKDGDGYYDLFWNTDGSYTCNQGKNYGYQDTLIDLANWTASHCTKNSNGHYETWWQGSGRNTQLYCY